MLPFSGLRVRSYIEDYILPGRSQLSTRVFLGVRSNDGCCIENNMSACFLQRDDWTCQTIRMQYIYKQVLVLSIFLFKQSQTIWRHKPGGMHSSVFSLHNTSERLCSPSSLVSCLSRVLAGRKERLFLPNPPAIVYIQRRFIYLHITHLRASARSESVLLCRTDTGPQ